MSCSRCIRWRNVVQVMFCLIMYFENNIMVQKHWAIFWNGIAILVDRTITVKSLISDNSMSKVGIFPDVDQF